MGRHTAGVEKSGKPTREISFTPHSPSLPNFSAKLACPGCLVVCGKRCFASNEWADAKVRGAFEFLIGFFSPALSDEECTIS